MEETQRNPPWGLDRIDQFRGLSNKYEYEYTGKGVTVYVLDSGMRITHKDFGRRAKCGFDYFPTKDCRDNSGHGTHVAGTVGGSTYGVAKDVNLVAVKVLGAGASTCSVLAGINYVVQQASKSTRVVVANMSLSFGFARVASVDQAIKNNPMILWVAAAANRNIDACGVTPAGDPDTLSVAATERGDSRASYSNWGSCVDIFAPGSFVLSSEERSDTASGTYHVACVAALYIQMDPTVSSTTIKRKILGDANNGLISDVRGSPNRLLNTESLGGVHCRAGGETETFMNPLGLDDNGYPREIWAYAQASRGSRTWDKYTLGVYYNEMSLNAYAFCVEQGYWDVTSYNVDCIGDNNDGYHTWEYSGDFVRGEWVYKESGSAARDCYALFTEISCCG